MARIPIPIDWNTVDSMLRCMCEGTEIAARLGISPDTLYRACQRDHKKVFQTYAASIYARTRILLREHQTRPKAYKRERPEVSVQGNIDRYGIYYRMNGQYYVAYHVPIVPSASNAISWFKMNHSFDKIVAIFAIRLK